MLYHFCFNKSKAFFNVFSPVFVHADALDTVHSKLCSLSLGLVWVYILVYSAGMKTPVP